MKRPILLSSVLFAGALLGGLVACGGPETGFEIPLLDSAHTPDILTEDRALEHPPSLAGNRYLKGWRARKQRGQVGMVPLPRDQDSFLELVHLASRPRELILHGDFEDLPDGAQVEVQVADRSPESLPLTNPLRIRLPGDLPLGRVPLALGFPESGSIRFRRAAFRSAAKPGDVEIEGSKIRQSGFSLVDMVRRLEAPAVLQVGFDPPRNPNPDQRFALLVETEDGEATTAFEWKPDFWTRLRGSRQIEWTLPTEPSLVRFRFLAEGEGSEAVWHPRIRFLETPEPTPAPAAPDPPRLVILYVLDALRADHMGHLSGREGLSPHFDRLAEEGVSFGRHLSVAPNTLPSSMSLFTGQIFLDLPQGRWKLAADGPETLAEVFRGAGFQTAIFAANGYLSEAFGTTRGFDFEGRDSIYDPRFETGAYNDSAERVHRATLQWLEQNPLDRPTFLYLHTLNPHNPYEPPASFLEGFVEEGASNLVASTDNLIEIKKTRRQVGAEDEERIRGLYAASMAYNDFHFGAFRKALEERFEPGEVLWIITSDHGDELFEHGGVLHGYTLYEEQLAIPLIFHWPGTLETKRSSAATDNLDLHETLRALVKAPPSGRGSGRSLWPILLEPSDESPGKGVRFAVASSAKGIYMARSDRAKYIWAPRAGTGWGLGEGRGRSREPEYFFDMVDDPGEQTNLMGTSSLEAAWLRSRLLAWIEKSRALEAGTTEDEGPLDEETIRHLKALGYLD